MSSYEKQTDLPVFDVPLAAWDERDRANGRTYQGRDYGRLLNAINNRQIPFACDRTRYFLNKEIADDFLAQFNAVTAQTVVAPQPVVDTADLRAALEQLLRAIGTLGTN